MNAISQKNESFSKWWSLKIQLWEVIKQDAVIFGFLVLLIILVGGAVLLLLLGKAVGEQQTALQ